MKLMLLYEKKRLVVEVGENDTVKTLKEFFIDHYSLNLKSSGDTEDMILRIVYSGSQLKDDWILSDIGILPGSILQCFLQSRDKIFMRAYTPFDQKTYDFTLPLDVEKTNVGEFKSMIQDVSGIPVSVIRLSKIPNGIELFDNRSLDDYDVMIGDTIHVDIWDGMGELLQSAFAGDVTATMNAIISSTEDPSLHKYQLRVALFIASFTGSIQLVSQLLKAGARCDDPVGEHPARVWCKNVFSHPLSLRTPAHAAAQTGRISCLRLFIHHNRACILVKDGHGCTPTGVARRYGQRECFKLLIAEQFRKQQYGGLSLSIYGKVRKWCDRARDRVAYYRLDPNFPVLLSSVDKTGHAAVVGSPIQVNGFGENIQNSAIKLEKSKIDAKCQWLWPRRDEISSTLKIDDQKGIKKPYRSLPPVRKHNSLKAKLSLKRSNSLESVMSSKASSELKRSFNEGYTNWQRRQKLKNTKNQVLINSKCRCKECSNCSCCGAVHLPDIHRPQSLVAHQDSNPDHFFITEDIRSHNRIIREESEPDASIASRRIDSDIRARPKLIPRSRTRLSRDVLTDEAHSVIEQATGQTSRQLAHSSLQVCETFTAVGWLKRLHLATNYNRKTLLRGMRDKGQSLSESCLSSN
ncbi:protein ANKUB1-like [Rhopilema esculentum]|uniref:protein ANKUB1-like n=1 Tax=Rhopilema esculentum TaxID=499914 RepID=UPI0031D13A39|eukprot:gene15675-6967_t